MRQETKIYLEKIWYKIIYPIAGIMLLILLFDIYNNENISTLPHQSYIIVLAVFIHIMYKIFNGDIWQE